MTNQFTVPDHPVNFRIWQEQSRQSFIEATAKQAKAHLNCKTVTMHQLSAWLRAHSIEVKDGSEFYRIYSLVNC